MADKPAEATVHRIIPAVQDHTKLEEYVRDVHDYVDELHGLIQDNLFDRYRLALDEALILLGREDLR